MYYVVYFTDEEKYFRSSRLMVSSILIAKKFVSKEYARRSLKNSEFAQLPCMILEFEKNDIFF